MNKKTELSAGLTYMRAAQNAMPRSLGDRERINGMSSAMSLAIRCCFEFRPEDANELRRMGIETCVGVFRPMEESFYRAACRDGGTYPRMWEQFHGIKAWRARKAVHFNADHRREVVENSRVCTHTAVLMPQTFASAEPDLASHDGHQVWWVTDFNNDTINLCRYKPSEGHWGALNRPGGAPARRRQVARADWEIFQAALAVQAGEDVRLKWTEADDISFAKGWFIVGNSYRKSILALPGASRGFASNEEAVAFVRKEAAKGDALSVKALLIHEKGLALPELPPAPQVEEAEQVALEV